MKGKSDAYVLWPLAKKFQNWIVDRSTTRDFTVLKRHWVGFSYPSTKDFFLFTFMGLRLCTQNEHIMTWGNNRSTLKVLIDFCLLRFYQKVLWNVRFKLNSSKFRVLEHVLKYVWSKSSFPVQKASILIRHT